MRLQGLGYELERGKHGQPEIKGYTKEYLEASSPRREQIKDHLREMGIDGAGAAQVAAHRTRDSKELLSPEEVLPRHRELAAQYGHQADRVVAEAREHAVSATFTNPTASRSRPSPMPAIISLSVPPYWIGETFWKRRSIAAWVKQRMPMSGRNSRSGQREASSARSIMPERGQQYTTAAMLRMEREIIARMQEGNQRGMMTRCWFLRRFALRPRTATRS